MALRIGALILASCQLLSGSVIDLDDHHLSFLPIRTAKFPVVLAPIKQHDTHGRDEECSNEHEERGKQSFLSLAVHRSGHDQERAQEKSEGKGGKKEDQKQEESRGDQKDEGKKIILKKSSNEKSQQKHEDQKKQVKKDDVKVAFKFDNTHKIQARSPKPSVILTNYVIGDSPSAQHHEKFDDDHINVNKTPVLFTKLRYVDNDDGHGQFEKAPITVVTVPEVSTAKTTYHKVAENQVINRSNIPSVKDKKNRSATELLFNYKNLSSTKIHPVTEVEEVRKTSVPKPVHSQLVRPGKLQKVVAKQIAIGQINENAPIVITNFLTKDESHRQQHEEECDEGHQSIQVHRRHFGHR